MVKSKVALGKMYKTTTDVSNFVSAPDGYHSVAAIPNIHPSMNYHEYVVYTSHACLPTHLVTYSFTATDEFKI
ncbi:hypothetical protein BGW42_003266 [Actinomortierella wolfii]|nr:hypothetical protein BGW42_003266 [Actinomortierella wolfii]